MTVHRAPVLFDGLEWSADGWVQVEGRTVVAWGTGNPPESAGAVHRHAALVAGLVDACAHVTGFYNRVMKGDALVPHRACLSLCREAGVTVVLSVGGHVEPCTALAQLGEQTEPMLLWTGPVLDGPPPASSATRLVLDSRSARRAVEAVVSDGARLVHTGPSLGLEALRAVVAAAGEHGVGVVHTPGRTSALQAAAAGVQVVQDLPRCLTPPTAGEDGSAARIRALADPGVRRTALEQLRALADHGTALVPLLHAWRRSSILDEAVDEPRLDRLLPMAPFHQYLLDMRGPGLVFGRKYARDYFGFEHLKGSTRKAFDDGWAFLLEALATAEATGVPLVAGSDALGLSLVPGYGLSEELAWWEAAGIPRRAVLTGATSRPMELLTGRTSPWASGVVALPSDPEALPSMAALPVGCQVLAGATSLPGGDPIDRPLAVEARR